MFSRKIDKQNFYFHNEFGGYMKLKYLRKKTGLNQTEFAKLFNIKQTTYSSYEIGAVKPDYETLVQIADYFNVSLDYLVGRNFQPVFALEDISKEQQEAVKLLLKLNDLNFIKAVSYMAGLYTAQG